MRRFGQTIEALLEEMDDVPDTTPATTQRMKYVPRYTLAALLADPDEPARPVAGLPPLPPLDLARFDPDWTGA